MKLLDRLLGGIVGLFIGYLLGMILGFIFFDPNADQWAFLGLVLGLVGLIIGLTNRYLVITEVAITALIGFYIGAIVGILLFGKPAYDDLLELTRTPGLYIAMIGCILGGITGYVLKLKVNLFFLAVSMNFGFLGGYFMGTGLGYAKYPSFVGWSPFVIGCAIVCYGALAIIGRRVKKPVP
jgi:hypothetical protein